MQRLFLRANLWSQQVLAKMAHERNAISPSSPIPQPGRHAADGELCWAAVEICSAAPPSPPFRRGLPFSAITAAMGLASGSRVYLCNLFLCFQFCTANFPSAWFLERDGFALSSPVMDASGRSGGRGGNVLRTWWRACVLGRACLPFAPNKPQPTTQLWRDHASHSWITCLWSRGGGVSPELAWWPLVALRRGRGGQHGEHIPGCSCCSAGLPSPALGVWKENPSFLGWLISGLADFSVSCSPQHCRGHSKGRSACSGHLSVAAVCLQSPMCGGLLPEADICLRFPKCGGRLPEAPLVRWPRGGYLPEVPHVQRPFSWGGWCAGFNPWGDSVSCRLWLGSNERRTGLLTSESRNWWQPRDEWANKGQLRATLARCLSQHKAALRKWLSGGTGPELTDLVSSWGKHEGGLGWELYLISVYLTWFCGFVFFGFLWFFLSLGLARLTLQDLKATITDIFSF